MSVENSPVRLVLIACGIALVGACCFVAWVALEQRPVERSSVAAVGSMTTTVVAAPATDAPVLTSAAQSVAMRYAVAAFTVTAGTRNDAWIAEVTPWCTAAWRAHLEAARSGMTIERTTVIATLVHVYPSWASSGSVAATIVVRSEGALASLYVELRFVNGRYLVEAAQ